MSPAYAAAPKPLGPMTLTGLAIAPFWVAWWILARPGFSRDQRAAALLWLAITVAFTGFIGGTSPAEMLARLIGQLLGT